MVLIAPASNPSLKRSAVIGVTIGAGVFFFFLIAGLLFESWSVTEFLSNLTLETVSWLLFLCGMTLATVAVPIALYLHYRIVAPLALLGVIASSWLAIGIFSGVIGAGALFGLSLYAVGLSPVYVLLYLLLGGGEYYARKQGWTPIR